MKKILWFSFVGALLGGILANWLSPRLIGWYFDPPVDIGVNCRAATEWAMARLQWAQLAGTVFGLVLGLVFYRLTSQRSKRLFP
jgi:membrane associated rhomboid family serine protease